MKKKVNSLIVKLYLEYLGYINYIVDGKRSGGSPDDVNKWDSGGAVCRPNKTEKKFKTAFERIDLHASIRIPRSKTGVFTFRHSGEKNHCVKARTVYRASKKKKEEEKARKVKEIIKYYNPFHFA